MNNYNYLILSALFLLMGLQSCKKDEEQQQEQDTNRITSVIADNFNLSVFNTGLGISGLQTKMRETGPFTVIAPSDNAFGLAGFNSESMLAAEPSRVSQIMNYHILDGRYELNKLPFLFNQEIRSSNGGKLFVTHWVKGPDTILTINGSRILAQNVAASNGLIQVVDQMLEPFTFQLVIEAVASDRNLSLFYQALQRANLLETLKKTGPYTIFAPSNAAMTAYGLSTLAAINEMDPAELKTILSYHILADRRFAYDYILSTGTTAISEQTMIDGNSIRVQLIPNYQVPGSFTGIQLRGTGNTSYITLTKRDVLTGNGVLHTIGAVLQITQ